MRSKYVPAAVSILPFFRTLLRHVDTISRRGILAAFSLLVAVSLVTSAAGDDLPGDPGDPPAPGASSPEHEEPYIEYWEAFWNGYNGYAVVGNVGGCDELSNVKISFGGVFAGQSTTTSLDGSFCLVIYHDESTGQIATAQATCHEGRKSVVMSLELL